MQDLELIEKAKALISERRSSQFRELAEELNPCDLADVLQELGKEDMLLAFRLLPKDTAAETFVELDRSEREQLFSNISDEEVKIVFDRLFLDDAVDVIEEMPANAVYRILRNTSPERRGEINRLLNYPAESAGSIMTTEYVSLKEGMTVEEAFEKIKRVGTAKETIYTCYITDPARRLLGIVTVKDMLLADSTASLDTLCERNIISAHTHEDREAVAGKLRRYDLLALPVVDDEGRLVGIVTVDDAMAVLDREAEEDFAKMAAMEPIEESYFNTSAFTHFKKRIVWLLVMMLSATVTGVFITKYEEAFAALPILVAFIPMLMDTGGNCGSQSSTMIIRGIATNEIKTKDILRAMRKELCIGLMSGCVLAIVTALRVFIMYNSMDQKLALIAVLAITLMVVTSAAKLLGCVLPILAKKLKLDPAIMAAPILTTIIDSVAVLTYFNIAKLLMNI